MEPLCTQALDGQYRCTSQRLHCGDARADRLAIQMHRAAAARCHPQTVYRALIGPRMSRKYHSSGISGFFIEGVECRWRDDRQFFLVGWISCERQL